MMLKTITTIFLSLTVSLVWSQKLMMIAQDPKSALNDTVIIGFDASATLGEDIALKEKNIFNGGNLSGLLTIVQREISGARCNYMPRPNNRYLSYDVNFDSKINLRSPFSKTLENRVFEIALANDVDYVIVKSDIPLGKIIEGLSFLNTSCNQIPSPVTYTYAAVGDEIRIRLLNPPTGIHSIRFNFIESVITSSNEKEVHENVASIYPNPVIEFCNIALSGDFSYLTGQSLIICKQTGEIVYQKEVKDFIAKNENINISHWSSGTYIWTITNSSLHGKFIKL
jgi:Secretion system C-terminal sorting domain